jgi:DNA polymerase-3 subunit chi
MQVNMAQIDLYLLNGHSFSDISEFACKLAEKAYGSDCHVEMLVDDEYQCSAIDQALWAQNQTSFLPHRLKSDPAHPKEITISFSGDNEPVKETNESSKTNQQLARIHLSARSFTPPKAGQRALILVANASDMLAEARNLYRVLKQQEQHVNLHDLRHKA